VTAEVRGSQEISSRAYAEEDIFPNDHQAGTHSELPHTRRRPPDL